MSLFTYFLTNAGAYALPEGKDHPDKYEVKQDQQPDGAVHIEIWNRHINTRQALVVVKIQKNGKELYCRIDGAYPFRASSKKVFAHYQTLNKLLRKAVKERNLS